MGDMNIADARLNGKKDGIAMQGLGKVRAGKRSFAHGNGLLIEDAYRRISSISGVPMKAVVPLTLILNRSEIMKEIGDGGNGPAILNVMDALNRNTLEAGDALPEKLAAGIEVPRRHRRDYALATLGAYCVNTEWDQTAAYAMQNPFHAVFVFMPGGKDRISAERALQSILIGHFRALDALLNRNFRELDVGSHEKMLRNSISGILESDPELKSLENALAEASRNGRAGAHVQLDMRQLHMIRAFIHEKGKDNLVLLMSFLDDLAKLGIAEEFRTPGKTGESAGGGQGTKHIWEILTENGFYGKNGMTVHAEEYVRRSVHGFFLKR